MQGTLRVDPLELGTRTSEVDLPPRAREGVGPLELRVLGTERAIAVERPALKIGAGSDNELRLHDPFASQRHCTLVFEDRGLWLHDLGSRNGTFVNDLRVDRCEVGAGARLVVGRTRLQLSCTGGVRGRHGLVGAGGAMGRVLAQIDRLGPTLEPVLILGETGTGKELVARALHEASPHRLGVLEPLNCAAIPRELAESELFGHARGAFTGAQHERRGVFERADRGTLFLDEVGEMPIDLQPKLLRVLEDENVQRVGGDRRIPVEVRLVTATHRDLLAESRRGRFRLDLFHRIAVGVIRLPPLRDRPEDLGALCEHFLAPCAAAGRPVVLDDAARSFLAAQPWPGNVRQLRNALHRAVAEGGPRLGLSDFSFLREGDGPAIEGADLSCVRIAGRSFAEIKREVFLKTLESKGGNKTTAALALEVPKSTFHDQVRAMVESSA
jgi:transcriptional regulator with GAF, ATPase, and Fis domain